MSLVCHHFLVNRGDRLYALREELRRAGRAGRTAERLAEAFDVSTRTVKRDIATLQRGGFPVWARPGPGGGYVVDRSATLPPVNFTEAEVAGLAAAVGVSRGQPFEKHLRAVLAKALGVMDSSARDRASALTGRVWIDRPADRSIAPAMRSVERALSEQLVLSLRYRDRHGDESRRKVDPVLLAHTQDHWYLVGYCRTAEDIRWFRVDRVVAARLTTEPASQISVDTVGSPPPSAVALRDI